MEDTVVFIVIMLGVIFVADAAKRWQRENMWRWRRDDDDGPHQA